MRILQVVRQYLPSTGGMETYVANLCRQLSERGHTSDVATLDYLFKSGKRLPAYEEIDGIRIMRLPSAGNARYFLAPRLLDLLPRYDLIHVHGVDFFIDLLGTFKGVHNKPVVLSTHGGFFHTSWFPSLKTVYFRTITRHSLGGVDRIIAVSPRDAELFASVTDNITIVENGIDYQTFAAMEKNVEKQSLVYVGRISKNKRVDRLLDAFSQIREVKPGARLTIIGPDWEGLQAGLKERAARLGLGSSVIFAGVIPQMDLLEVLASAHLFVSASEYEGFGLSAVEAMASSTIPVLNRNDAFENLIDDGVNGFITEFDNKNVAGHTLLTALSLSDKRLQEIGAAARATASRFDWRQVAWSIEKIYDQVLSIREI